MGRDRNVGASESRPPRILVVDDDEAVGTSISAAAERMGCICTLVTEASKVAASLGPEVGLIVLDLQMPHTDGIQVLRLLHDRKSRAHIVLMTGLDQRILGTAEELARSLGLRVAARLKKPFRLAQLEEIFEKYSDIDPQKTKTWPRVQVDEVMEEELRRAVHRDEFVLHYQPQIEISTGRVVGVEALVRWQHPTVGLIFPDAFIPRAESLDMIDDIGWLVARRGLAEVGALSENDQALSISLNISAHSLHDLSLPDRYLELAAKHGVSPSSIVLEITESGLVRELDKALDILTRMRIKGIHLSIDDFGTGYGTMQQLRRVPATELKVDKSFVQDMHRKDDAGVLVRTMIGLGHDLGMKVVAEGVETQQQLMTLRDLGCDVAQGYFFSRPLPVAEAVAWITKQNRR